MFIATLDNRIFPIDDAFVGLLLKEVGKFPTSNPGFLSWGKKQEEIDKLKCFWHDNVIYFHRKLPDELKRQWKEYLEQDERDECKYR